MLKGTKKFFSTRICHAIKLLVRLEELPGKVENISGRVLCKSTIAYLKKAQTAAKTAANVRNHVKRRRRARQIRIY